MLAFVAPLLAAASLQSALDARVAEAPGTAIVAGVIDHGVQRVYLAGSGGNGRPVDEHTLFEIGSVTKTFTATTLATMVLRGQVRLSDPISKYLPKGVRAPSEAGRQITLLDLAEQRSGLPRLPSNMTDVAGDDPYADYTNADMYAFLSGYELTRRPGAAYEYSNFGIGLLGQLLANRAGTTYPALVHANVLRPLGMNETAFLTTGTADPAQLAVGHDLNADPVATWHAQAIVPAGTIASSIADMLRFLRCNMGQGPLAHACLFAQVPRADGEARHRIGLVWNVSSSTGVVSHGGDTNGFHSYVAISRDRQTGVVVLSNGPAVADIASHVLVPSFPIAACPASVPAGDVDPAAYAGVYCNPSTGLQFTVAPSNKPDELSIALLPQPAVSVKRSGTDTYSQPAVGATFKFARGDGGIVGLWLLQYGQEIPAVRLDAQGKGFVSQLPSPFPKVVPLDLPVLTQYVGSYKTGEIGTITVTLRGGSVLYVQLTGQPAARVYPSARDEFFYKIVDAQISFNRDASGTVKSLTLHQNGQEITASRISP